MTLAMCFLSLSLSLSVRVCWLFQPAVSRSVATDGFWGRDGHDADMYVGAAACVAWVEGSRGLRVLHNLWAHSFSALGIEGSRWLGVRCVKAERAIADCQVRGFCSGTELGSNVGGRG